MEAHTSTCEPLARRQTHPPLDPIANPSGSSIGKLSSSSSPSIREGKEAESPRISRQMGCPRASERASTILFVQSTTKPLPLLLDASFWQAPTPDLCSSFTRVCKRWDLIIMARAEVAKTRRSKRTIGDSNRSTTTTRSDRLTTRPRSPGNLGTYLPKHLLAHFSAAFHRFQEGH